MRDLRPDEASVSAAIHRQVLDMEFLARFGTGFLTAYHRAWIRSPAGLSLAATDSSGRITGVMLGSLDPAAHYDWLLRKAGAGLGVRMGAYALVHPSLARELVATRAGRYTRAVAVRVAARARRALSGAGRDSAGQDGTGRDSAGQDGTGRDSAGQDGGRDGTGQGADLSSNPSPARRAGEITHLMVVPDGRGGGYGRALVEETERRATAAGVAELVLVTPPDLDARQFYEHLGWETVGDMTSRSGEEFIRFRRALPNPQAETPDRS